ncbi:hypothetical protein BH11BAC1_BH11BAC1_21390 [soil metagenome]
MTGDEGAGKKLFVNDDRHFGRVDCMLCVIVLWWQKNNPATKSYGHKEAGY